MDFEEPGGATMDYKAIADQLEKIADSDPAVIAEWAAVIRTKYLKNAANAITDLLARAEAAEARAEKAEREMGAYKEMLYKERPCYFCAGYTGEWNAECLRCDRCTKEYRPQFRLRELKEE